MEDKVKNIISTFIKVPAEQISSDTVIDRTAVSSSITLHRMYAKLAEEGIIVEDYWNIKNVATLLKRLNGNGHAIVSGKQEGESSNFVSPPANYVTGSTVGIDIEEVDSMPKTNDFREEEFYKMNFSSAEIAYCILQPNPYASFAGLFAAKEAIVKANNTNRSKPFNTIIINHNAEGKPVYPGFNVSVSHTNNVAVAVALPEVVDTSIRKTDDQIVSQPTSRISAELLLFVISFLISLIALIISLVK
jgi:phosphopantetheine--protein transferase-like protein